MRTKAARRGRQQVSRSGGAAASAIATAAGGTGAKYLPRLAPPPLSLTELLAWTAVSIAAYFCFLILPGRLNKRKIHRKLNPMVANDDLAYAANHLHYGIWCWPLFDLVYRFLCYSCLPRWELVKMGFFATLKQTIGNSSSGSGSEQQNGGLSTDAGSSTDSGSLGDSKARIFDQRVIEIFSPIRAILGQDSLVVGPLSKDEWAQDRLDRIQAAAATTEGGEQLFGSFHHTHLFVVISTTLLVTLFVSYLVYRIYVRPIRIARRVIQEKGIRQPAPYPMSPDELPEVFTSDEKRKEFEAHHELYAIAEANMFPTVYGVCLWCITYAALFAYSRALSLLISQLYPPMVGILVLYLVFLPG